MADVDVMDQSQWLSADAGPLLGLRLSVSRHPWRIGPAWALLAGALASGASLAGGTALLRVAGAIILADAAWGSVWSVMAGGGARQADEPWGLPYVQPEAPVMQLSRRVRELAAGAGCRELAAGAGLALGLAALLGGTAFWLSLAAIGTAFVAQMVAERGGWPALAHALLALGLPWALGLGLSGRPATDLAWPLALGAAFTILEWGGGQARGAGRRARRPASAFWATWLGQAAVLAVLATLRLPWAICPVAMLFLPPALWLLRASAQSPHARRAAALKLAVSHSLPWWWLALLVAALAVRQFVTL